MCGPGILTSVEVGLAFAGGGQGAYAGVIADPGHQQLLGRKPGDDLAAVAGDDQLLFDACCRPAVGGGPEGLQCEGHALFDHFGAVQRGVAAEDGLLPDGESDAVAVLEGECSLLTGESELLGPGPPTCNVGSSYSRFDHVD